MTALLSVARVLHQTRAEGPNLRSAIWVHGCSIRCSGCINPHLFEFREPQSDPRELAEEILASGAEGITLLGGEPFDQAEACAILSEEVQAYGLGVITFSGYTHTQLRTGSSHARRLLAATDLLIDGPYRSSDPETNRALVGSANQRFNHLTDRYSGFNPDATPNRLAARIDQNGTVQLAGFLTQSQLSHVRQRLA